MGAGSKILHLPSFSSAMKGKNKPMLSLWCLHGFLGTGKDWKSLAASLDPFPGLSLHCPDILASPGEIRAFPYWARKFNARAAGREGINILLGYSMGGRLALHALLQPGSPWKGAVIVSAHPGLSSPAERETRLARDEEWASRFEKDPWEKLIRDWNAQPVFGGKEPPFQRREEDFSRAALAKALRTWSLGRQDSLLDRLHHVRIPVLWLAGEEDERYVRLGKYAVRLLPRGTLKTFPDTGHRVPWEAPRAFSSAVKNFLAGFQTPAAPYST